MTGVVASMVLGRSWLIASSPTGKSIAGKYRFSLEERGAKAKVSPGVGTKVLM